MNLARAFPFSMATLCLLASAVTAQEEPQGEPPSAAKPEKAEKTEDESPWLVTPLFSLNPKLGASVGVMGAYIHYFDEKSRPSMFGVNGQYTSTESVIAGLFARMSWDEDHQRVVGLFVNGKIRNDYDDYLGTGVPLKTNDELHAIVGRYLYRVHGDFFLGVQGAYSNYQVLGNSAWDDQVLDILGLQGFKSGGIGPSIYFDSRDSENMPTKGLMLNVNDISYRDWIAGSNNFDVVRGDFRGFFEHGAGNVLAVRQFNQWTVDAPTASFAPVQLRGYKMGQYLAEYMSSIEVEERLRLGDKWTSTLFVGAAVLYGDSPTGNDYDNFYPSIGAGLQYVLKQKEGIVVNLEGAIGDRENYGIYIKLGYGW